MEIILLTDANLCTAEFLRQRGELNRYSKNFLYNVNKYTIDCSLNIKLLYSFGNILNNYEQNRNERKIFIEELNIKMIKMY